MSTIVSSPEFRHLSKLENWESAIEEAERQIREAQAHVRRLKRSVAIFRKLCDSGEPWPGTSESENEDMGQEGHLGQSPTLQLYNFTAFQLYSFSACQPP